MTSQENSQGLSQLTSSTLKMLRVGMQNVLDDVADEHNITVRVGNASYSGKEATFKVHITLNNSNLPTSEEESYDLHATLYGLPKRGEFVTLNNTIYKLVGFKPRSTKYPVLATDVKTNKTYKLPLELVINAYKQERR